MPAPSATRPPLRPGGHCLLLAAAACCAARRHQHARRGHGPILQRLGAHPGCGPNAGTISGARPS
eukprot:6098054-Lingulodinium_polyedra.AAC.1